MTNSKGCRENCLSSSSQLHHTVDSNKRQAVLMDTGKNVYFALEDQRFIKSVFIENGVVISEEPFARHALPLKWVEALQEIEEYFKTDRVPPNHHLPAAASSLSTPLSHGSEEFDQIFLSLFPEMHPLPAATNVSSPHNPLISEDMLAIQCDPSSTALPSTVDAGYCDSAVFSATSQTTPFTPYGYLPEPSQNQTTLSTSRRSAGEKRADKLKGLMNALKTSNAPSRDMHNKQVDDLWNGTKLSIPLERLSSLGFAAVLGRLSNMANSAATIYGLLSWRVFGLEESWLVDIRKVAPNMAAKQVRRSSHSSGTGESQAGLLRTDPGRV